MYYEAFTSYTAKILIVFTILITLFLDSVTVRLSLKLIEYIQKAMKELDNGNTYYNFKYTSNDEIGDLTYDVRFASQKLYTVFYFFLMHIFLGYTYGRKLRRKESNR